MLKLQKMMNSVEVALWAFKAGDAGSFIFDKYCQKFKEARLTLRVTVEMNQGIWIEAPTASFRIMVTDAKGDYRRFKSIYLGEEIDAVQLISTMEDILKEYNNYSKSKRRI